jgi:hypothetical protein
MRDSSWLHVIDNKQNVDCRPFIAESHGGLDEDDEGKRETNEIEKRFDCDLSQTTKHACKILFAWLTTSKC